MQNQSKIEAEATETGWSPTHEIVGNGDTHRVCLVGKAAYTAAEWVYGLLSDWTMNRYGDLFFRGTEVHKAGGIRIRELAIDGVVR